MRRPMWFVAIYLGIQIAIPTLMLSFRLLTGSCYFGGWQMYACY